MSFYIGSIVSYFLLCNLLTAPSPIMTNLNLVRPGFRLTGSGAGAPSVLVRGGHSFIKRTILLEWTKALERKKWMDGWKEDGQTKWIVQGNRKKDHFFKKRT